MADCTQCGKSYPDDIRFCVVDGTDLQGGGAADPAPPALGPGATLGDYRLSKLLGEGGMGQVFAAEHMRLGRRVAIKTLRPEYGRDPVAVGRFFSEARTVNQIRQEHIVEITDFVDDDPHHTYCVMELLEGRTLYEELLLAPGGLERARAVSIARQVAEAMAVVHETGVVHRDLKPANIFITHRAGQTDWVKLLDFGIAKLQREGLGQPGQAQTVAGAILGTPEYMSPEQASGKTVDHRTDVYALGVILFEMVTGSQPFRAGSLGEMVVQHLTTPPPRPSDCVGAAEPVDPALDTLILDCLAKEPAERPDSMSEVHDRLVRIAEGRAAHAPAAPTPDAASMPEAMAPVPAAMEDGLDPPPPGRPWVRWLAFGGVGAVAVAALVALAAPRDRGEAADVPAAPEPRAVTPAPAGEDEAAVAATETEPPEEISLTFESTPAGARVFRPGEQDVLGTTPLTLALPRADEEATFELRLDGHRPVRQSVSLAESGRVSVELVVAPRHPVARTRRPPPAKQTDTKKAPAERPARDFDPTGIIDPFED